MKNHNDYTLGEIEALILFSRDAALISPDISFRAFAALGQLREFLEGQQKVLHQYKTVLPEVQKINQPQPIPRNKRERYFRSMDEDAFVTCVLVEA